MQWIVYGVLTALAILALVLAAQAVLQPRVKNQRVTMFIVGLIGAGIVVLVDFVFQRYWFGGL